MSEQTPLGPVPNDLPEVPNIDEHPSFNEDTPTVVTGPEVENEAPTSLDGKEELQPAIGIHVVFMEDGQFGIQATGEPNLGEMQMLLSRALKSVESRMIGETITQIMKQNKSRIITPGR